MKKILAIALLIACLCSTAGAEMLRFPVAIVNVKPGSWLNVRKTPEGELTFTQLKRNTDVVILQELDGWALVQRPERMDAQAPLGWVCMDYLIIYREFMMEAANK